MNLDLIHELLDWKLAHINPVLGSQSGEKHVTSHQDLVLSWTLPITLQIQRVFFDMCAHLLQFLYYVFKAGVQNTVAF